jgi:Flp pilus assembly protein TadG
MEGNVSGWTRRNERGANLAEFAIIAPLLLLLVVGVADFGRAFQTYIVITNAAREGARMGARLSCYQNNASQRANYRNAIIQATIDAAAGNGLTVTTADITISPDPASGTCQNAGLAFRVTVSHDVDTILGGIIGVDAISVVSTAAMSKIGAPVVQP